LLGGLAAWVCSERSSTVQPGRSIVACRCIGSDGVLTSAERLAWQRDSICRCACMLTAPWPHPSTGFRALVRAARYCEQRFAWELWRIRALHRRQPVTASCAPRWFLRFLDRREAAAVEEGLEPRQIALVCRKSAEASTSWGIPATSSGITLGARSASLDEDPSALWSLPKVAACCGEGSTLTGLASCDRQTCPRKGYRFDPAA